MADGEEDEDSYVVDDDEEEEEAVEGGAADLRCLERRRGLGGDRNELELRTKNGTHDVARLADLVVAKDTNSLVFALLGLTGSGRRSGVVKGEADAFASEHFETSLAFDAAVEIDGIRAIFLGGELHASWLRHGGERGLAAVRIKLAAGGEHIERTTVAIGEATGRFEIVGVEADFRHLAFLHLLQLPAGAFEVFLLIQHRLRGIAKGGKARFQGRELRRRPADARGDGVDFSEVVGRPVHKSLGAVRDVVFAWHGWCWVGSSRFQVQSSTCAVLGSMFTAHAGTGLVDAGTNDGDCTKRANASATGVVGAVRGDWRKTTRGSATGRGDWFPITGESHVGTRD